MSRAGTFPASVWGSPVGLKQGLQDHRARVCDYATIRHGGRQTGNADLLRRIPPLSLLETNYTLTPPPQLRFPEPSLQLRRLGADIISYPSAFTIPTGQAHFEILLRARAIETQSYVFAAAQIGKHNERRSSYGHTMIVDPWGKVVAECSRVKVGDVPKAAGDVEPEICFAEVDASLLERVRREVPLKRRL